MRELLYTIRRLRRAPAFSLVAVVTLALAIGSTTAVFSVVDAVVLRGLPYGDAAKLRTIYERSDDGNFRVPSYPTFLDWQRAGASLGNAIDGFAFVRGDGLTIGDNPERLIAAFVSPGFFRLMRSAPLLGRTFLPDEEQPGGPRVAVLSYDFFMRRFGGDRGIIGRVVAVDSVPTTVVGVMPSGFAFPNFGGGGWLPPAVWQPITIFRETHPALMQRVLHVDSRALVRLRPGVDSARAAAAMQTIERRLAGEYPNEQAHWTSVIMQSLPDELFGQLWGTLALIAGAIGLVLLLACVSVANLLLIRYSVRARELAVRAALGAGRWRLTRQPLAEAGAIALASGLVGLGLAAGLLAAARPFAAERLPFATHITINPRVALFALAVTALTALLVGTLAGVQAGRQNLAARLRGAGGIGTTASGRGAEARVRNALVSMQFALAITLLIGAGLLLQSVRRVTLVPLDYEPNGLVDFAISPPEHRYTAPQDAAALYARIIEAVRAVPSVRSVAAAGGALLDTKVVTPDHPADASAPTALYHPISSDYLRTMGIRLEAGRDFTDDDMRSPVGLLVTSNLAKRLWPGKNAIGQRITIYRQSQARTDVGAPITLPVVGVVADYRQLGAESDPPAQVFLPYTLEVWPWMHFVARATAAPGVLESMERAVRGVEPALSFYSKPTFDRSGQLPSLDDPRMFVTGLLAAFGGTALLLAAVGLYGVVAYAVAQRTREIGIRIAIGAAPRHIVSLIVRQASGFVFAGIGVGLVVALGVSRVLRALLFQTAATDPGTFVIVPVVLAIVAVAATVLPAMRATRTDPAIVIKSE